MVSFVATILLYLMIIADRELVKLCWLTNIFCHFIGGVSDVIYLTEHGFVLFLLLTTDERSYYLFSEGHIAAFATKHTLSSK